MTEKSGFLLDDCSKDSNLKPTEDFLIKLEYNEQRSLSSSFDPRELSRRIKKGYRMRIRKGTKKVTLHKFLMAKMLIDEEGLHLDEYIVLNELHFNLLENQEKDFLNKNSNYLRKSGKLLSLVSQNLVFPMVIKQKPSETYLSQNEIPTRRQYYGLKGQRDLRNSFRLILNDTIIHPKIPDERYIGVGYKDKGSRRQPNLDGSPSWQEVATHFCNIEREAEDSSSTENSPEERDPQI
jgi:hypothetical protein